MRHGLRKHAQATWASGAAAILVFTLGIVLSGCGTSTPYFLIESKRVESDQPLAPPDVTETPTFRANRGGIRTVGLQPPDVCADQGLSRSIGAGQLQLGVLRTRCGVEMAEFERALSRSGYQVMSWGAISAMAAKQEIPTIEAARKLGIDVLLQVNALERIEIQTGRDARFERRFYRATPTGARRESAAVPEAQASEFENLIQSRESRLSADRRIGATINVSAVWVETGATLWFYEWTQVDRANGISDVTLLVDCRDGVCREVEREQPAVASGPVEGSISGFSQAGDPADEKQAIFQGLVRELVTDLAERLAGRRS